MKPKWLVIEQGEARAGLWSTGFLNSYHAATKKSVTVPLQVLTHWPGLGCCHSDESVNGGKFLSQICNSLAFWERAFFVGRNHLLSWKPHQKGTNAVSSASCIHFCPLSFYRCWECKISVNSMESQSLWWIKLSLYDWVGCGLAGGTCQERCSSTQGTQCSPHCSENSLVGLSLLVDSQRCESSDTLLYGFQDPCQLP